MKQDGTPFLENMTSPRILQHLIKPGREAAVMSEGISCTPSEATGDPQYRSMEAKDRAED